jgi:hypothetical protein
MMGGQVTISTWDCACTVRENGDVRWIEHCPLHAAAPELLEACKDMLKATDELMTEFISKKRAADWGVINQAMVDAGKAIAKARGKGK